MELYNLLELVKIMGLHNHVWIELVEEKYNAMIKERNDLADEVDRLNTHILSDGAFQEWQPIETAPKDGTRIHGWNGNYQTTIYWYVAPKPPYESCWAQVQGLQDEFYDDGVWNPTHWMPLPLSPKEQS